MIAVLTGLPLEARILPADIPHACSGADPAKALAEARRLLAEGAAGLVSFGLAGGLVPEFPAGGLVVGAVVVTERYRLPCDPAMSGRLAELLPCAHIGAIAASEAVLCTPSAKAELGERTGAIAVDMESGAVAAACLEANKPFAVLRAVADPLTAKIPPAALAAVRGLGPLALSLLLRPTQLGALLRLSRDSRKALGALAAAAPALAALGHHPGD